MVNTLCALLDELVPESKFKPHAQLITYVPTGPGMTAAMRSTPASSKASWAGSAQESFETGLRKTVEWYLANAAWVENVTSGAYQQWVDTELRRPRGGRRPGAGRGGAR